MPPTYPLTEVFTHQTPSHTTTIHWTRIGNPTLPPLILIHGTPWSSYVWTNLATTLSTRYSIYLYDHPGFGLSHPPTRHPNTPPNPAADLDASLTLRAAASAALIKSWNLPRRPHVLAHDNGGLVALRLLLEHGVAFASLCLLDVVALGPFGLPVFKLVAENRTVFEALPASFAEGFVRAYVRSATVRAVGVEVEDGLCEVWSERGQGVSAFWGEMVQAHHREVGGLEGRYAEVGGRVPTKIIWGEEDAWLPVETAARLKEALNAEEVVVIPDAGHLVQYDQPARLALEVGLWLSEH